MHLVVLNWIGLVVSTGLGIAVGILLLKYLSRHELPDEPETQAQGFLTDALAYVSGVRSTFCQRQLNGRRIKLTARR